MLFVRKGRRFASRSNRHEKGRSRRNLKFDLLSQTVFVEMPITKWSDDRNPNPAKALPLRSVIPNNPYD